MRSVKTMCIVYRYHVGTFSTEDVLVIEINEVFAKALIEKKGMIADELLSRMISNLVALQSGSLVTIGEIVQIKEWEGGL